MLIDDADPVTIIFRCCSERRIVSLAELKKAPLRQFQCQSRNCGAIVSYNLAEFTALVNKSKSALDITISLYPL